MIKPGKFTSQPTVRKSRTTYILHRGDISASTTSYIVDDPTDYIAGQFKRLHQLAMSASQHT